MGLLDDLKKQAELVKAQQRETSLTAETIGLVDGRMKQAFAYLNDLLNQFKVLKPQNPLTYVLPGVGELKNLGFEDTFIDYRRKKIHDKDCYDTIRLFVRWQGGEPLTVERDMPGTIEKTREILWQCKAKFDEDETRTQYGTVSHIRFKVKAVIVTEIAIKADYENRRLLLQTSQHHRGMRPPSRYDQHDVDDSKTESGVEALSRKEIDLEGLVREACELFEPTAEDKGVTLSCDVPKKSHLCGDDRMIQRMLSNLLDNAIKYTPSGGAVTVSVSENDERNVVIAVKDTGIGISPNELPRIFERFYRCDESRSEPGIGLGLSLARAIARAHGGDITVTSRLNEGSTFAVTLPKSLPSHS